MSDPDARLSVMLRRGIGTLKFGASPAQVESYFGEPYSRDDGFSRGPVWSWRVAQLHPHGDGTLHAGFEPVVDGRLAVVAFKSDSRHVRYRHLALCGANEEDALRDLRNTGLTFLATLDTSGMDYLAFSDGLTLTSRGKVIIDFSWTVDDAGMFWIDATAPRVVDWSHPSLQ